MNGQKNILSIIIAVVITVFGCYFFLPSYSSKQLEISYETTLQQNKKDYEKQIKSLETEILTLEKNVDYYKEKAEEAEAKKRQNPATVPKSAHRAGLPRANLLKVVIPASQAIIRQMTKPIPTYSTKIQANSIIRGATA